MITNLYIKNFKSLKEVNLELRPLNLLTGLNGSGKSSLIQVLLLLRQSNSVLKSNGKLLLQKDEQELFDAGVASDVYYQFGIEKNIQFTLKSAKKVILDLKLDCDVLANPDANTLDISSISPKSTTSSFFNYSFHYLNAERLSPQNFYKRNVDTVEKEKSIGVFGEYTTHFLEIFGTQKVLHKELHHEKSKSDILVHLVEAWLGEISPNASLRIDKISNEEVKISYQFGTNNGKTKPIKPKNVGFGLSYVLPVVTALLTAEAGKLIIIENPESHIHPRGQAELGRLIAAAAQTGAQLIIETHSDHILNGIRVAVKENPVIKDLVNIFFYDRVEKNEEQYTEITPIKVDRHGDLSNYPDNFLDEWSNQLLNLV